MVCPIGRTTGFAVPLDPVCHWALRTKPRYVRSGIFVNRYLYATVQPRTAPAQPPDNTRQACPCSGSTATEKDAPSGGLRREGTTAQRHTSRKGKHYGACPIHQRTLATIF